MLKFRLLILFFLPFILNADFIVNGFGTLSGTYINQDSSYVMYTDQNSSDSDNIDFKSGSNFGLQATYDYKKITFIGQTIFRDSIYKDIYEPRLEWLFAKTSITDNLTISLGRLKLDTYLYSQTLYVDFVRPFAKLPAEIYTSIPFSNHDGIDLSYVKMFDDYKFSSTLSLSTVNRSNIGESENKSDLELDKGKLLSFSLENDNFLLKATYLEGMLSMVDAPHNAPPDLINIEKKMTIKSIGFEYMFDRAKFSSEYLERKSGLIEDIESYYLALSYSMNNKLIPYVYYANMKSFFNRTAPEPRPDELSIMDMNISNDFLDFVSYMSANEPMETYTIGTRYNLSNNISIKSEVQHKIDTYSDDKSNTILLSLDFVF
jgi:hypothetical protein